MGTHSSILAWKIPWTEEPGRLQSMGSQRVGLSDFTFTFFHRAHYFCPLSLGRSRVNLVLHILLVKAVMSSVQIPEEDVINLSLYCFALRKWWDCLQLFGVEYLQLLVYLSAAPAI